MKKIVRKMWLAQDADGNVILHANKPEYNQDLGYWFQREMESDEVISLSRLPGRANKDASRTLKEVEVTIVRAD